jgi:hypothetical protein
MTVQISTINDERIFNRYLAMRHAPRDTLVFGVHPNAHKALVEYEYLTIALSGGNDSIDDLSSMATYHAGAVAAVTPFIAALRAAMKTINDTMHIVNVLAAATGQDAPFAIEPEEITVQAYIATLQSAVATLTATAQATAAIAQQLGGGE